MDGSIRRRELLAAAMTAGGAFALGPGFLRTALARAAMPGDGPYGPPVPTDFPGLALPRNFTGREIARGGAEVGGYLWHFASDGQATYRTSAGGWILVSNSEAPSALGGGSSAIRFAPDGEVERAYRILAGTNLNCAGGPTPWGTWLSCEEHPGGMVWEADPAGVLPAQPRPALGNFAHEAAAVDPVHGHVYLTEDEDDGCLYRFRPERYPSLQAGVLEVALAAPGGRLVWRAVPDPNLVTKGVPTRDQVPGALRFDGGEGLWYDDGVVHFTTKGDKRVWAYDTTTRRLDVLYDGRATPTPLDAVDNVCVAASGDVFVCEDGGNMEIGLITPKGEVAPFCRLTGREHAGSEMVGVVFDPSGTRMYFGSQRAYPYAGGTPAAQGAIYEVTGPFNLPPGGVPSRKVFGPPAGERVLPLPSGAVAPGLRVHAPERLGRNAVAADGVTARVHLSAPATVDAVLRSGDLQDADYPRWAERRPVTRTLAAARSLRLPAGTHEIRLAPRSTTTALLEQRGRGGRAVLTVVARSGRGRRRVAARVVRI